MQHFKYMIYHDVWNVIYISHIIFHGIWFAQRQAVLRDIYCKNFWKFSAAHDNRGVQLSTRYVTICSLGRLSAKLEVSGIFARQLDLIQIQYRYKYNTGIIQIHYPGFLLGSAPWSWPTATGPVQWVRKDATQYEKTFPGTDAVRSNLLPTSILQALAPPCTTLHHLGLFTQITGRNAGEEEERCNGEEGEVTSGEWKESSPFSSFSSRQCERPLLSPQSSAWACTWSKVRSEKAEREARRTHMCCLAVRRGQPSRHLSLLFETILLPRSQTHSFPQFSRCNFSELSESSLGMFKAFVLWFLWPNIWSKNSPREYKCHCAFSVTTSSNAQRVV